jgi:hypothetical protein
MDANTPPDTKVLKKKEKPSGFAFAVIDGKDPDLITALQSVDTGAPDAKLNETSISDDLGGRIELNEDDDEVVKK